MGVRGRGRPRGRKPGRGASLAPRDARVRPPSLHECFATRCGDILDRLQKKDTLNIFLEPVDNNIAPDYDVIVQRKMDFSTVRGKLDAGEYEDDLRAFHADLSLIWSNCLLYNGAELDNVYSKKAAELRKLVDGRLIPSTVASLENDRHVLDQWTERHRRKPHASPTSSARDGSQPLMPGGGGLGPSAADGEGVSIQPTMQVSVETGITPEDVERQALEQARASAAAARRVALRNQYSNGGLYSPPPAAGKEPVYFVDTDTPAFRPSMVRYNPHAKPDEDVASGSGLGLGSPRVMSTFHSQKPSLEPYAMGASQANPLQSSILRPAHYISSAAHIQKRRLDIPGLAYKTLGSKQRQNACRPMSSVSSIKVKDYVQSLQGFVAGAGTIATKIIGELLSPEIAVLREEERRKQRKRDAAATETPGGDPESMSTQGNRAAKISATAASEADRPGDISQVGSLLPKLSKQIDELDGLEGLERIVGPDIANEVRVLPTESIDFTMPYGLRPAEMGSLAQLTARMQGLPNQPSLAFLLTMKGETESHVRRMQAARATSNPPPSGTRVGVSRVPHVSSPPTHHPSPPPGGSPYAQTPARQIRGPGAQMRTPTGMPSPMSSMRGQSQVPQGMASTMRTSSGVTPDSLKPPENEFTLRTPVDERTGAPLMAETRDHEIRSAARRTQTNRATAYAHAAAAAGNVPMASPVGAMHDGVYMNMTMPAGMLRRVAEVEDSFRGHAKEAADLAMKTAESVMASPSVPGADGASSMDLRTHSQRESSAGSAGRGSSSSQPLSPADENTACGNCLTKDTPGWRQGPSRGDRLCNACGLYFLKHKQMRPAEVWSKKRSSGSIRSTGSGGGSTGGGSNSKAPSGKAARGAGSSNLAAKKSAVAHRGFSVGNHTPLARSRSSQEFEHALRPDQQQQHHAQRRVKKHEEHQHSQPIPPIQQPLASISSLDPHTPVSYQPKTDGGFGQSHLSLEKLMQPVGGPMGSGQSVGKFPHVSSDNRTDIFAAQNPQPIRHVGGQHQLQQSVPRNLGMDLKGSTSHSGQGEAAPAMQSHIPSVQDMLQNSGRQASAPTGLASIPSFAGQSAPEFRQGASQIGSGLGVSANNHVGGVNLPGPGQHQMVMNNMFMPSAGLDLGASSNGSKPDDAVRQMNVSELLSGTDRPVGQPSSLDGPVPLLDGPPSQQDPGMGVSVANDQHMVNNLFGMGDDNVNAGGLGGSGGGAFGF